LSHYFFEVEITVLKIRKGNNNKKYKAATKNTESYSKLFGRADLHPA